MIQNNQEIQVQHAIAVCGMLEMDQWLKEEDPSKKVYQKKLVTTSLAH